MAAMAVAAAAIAPAAANTREIFASRCCTFILSSMSGRMYLHQYGWTFRNHSISEPHLILNLIWLWVWQDRHICTTQPIVWLGLWTTPFATSDITQLFTAPTLLNYPQSPLPWASCRNVHNWIRHSSGRLLRCGLWGGRWTLGFDSGF